MSENKRQSETGVVINDKSQRSIATHLKLVKLSIITLLKIYCESAGKFSFKSLNICHSYRQDGGLFALDDHVQRDVSSMRVRILGHAVHFYELVYSFLEHSV